MSELFVRGISCCRLSALLPVGTAIKFPVLRYLLGRLRRADIRELVKRDRFGDLPEFILGAGIGSCEFCIEHGRHQDSGSCEALRFNVVGILKIAKEL